MDHRSFPGCTIWEFADILLNEAVEKKCLIYGDFNGTPLLAYPNVPKEEMLRNWFIVRAEQQSVA